jgi:Uma2 family endonuclease
MAGFAEDPRASYSAFMGKAEFFAWRQTREGPRCELKDGEIVLHPGVSRNHYRVAGHWYSALRHRLTVEVWDIAAGDFAVEIGADIRFPDVVVERVVHDGDAYATQDPILLVEVLSPSSAGCDLRIKAGKYLSLPSLEAYIVASQDEPVVSVWQRDPGTWSFAAEPVEIGGRDRAVTIGALGITVPRDEIYRGIVRA